ncbi:Dihydroorotate dehydrogenase (quinone), mitochondrial [Sporothrix epigloea]|uniref:Dihydroorotate dehydrogenase (Quinone), mitochondrial n=1 Tax=Sporothrix epigloea TaxID=1892477 RepID=A0ABP0E048_9PEZI
MSSTSPKPAARVAGPKIRRRTHIKAPLSPSAASTTTTTTNPRQKRFRTRLSRRAYLLMLAAKGITRRVTRSMTRRQALLDQKTSSARVVPHQFEAPCCSPALDAGAIVLFNDTNGGPFQAVHFRPGDDNSPVFLPRGLQSVVPDMDQYGLHNCGRHGGEASKRLVHVACRDCRTSFPVAALHCLPCGHVLCRSCLKEAVWTIDANLHNTHIWDAIQQHVRSAVSTRGAVAKAAAKSASKRPGRSTTRDGADLALDRAGMTCCGRFMQLDRHMACLDAATAAAYWLAHEVLRHPLEASRHRCGWPDCGQILAPTCYFQRESFQMYYCVRCQGNSLYVREGYLAPARPCDERGR